MTSNPYIAFTSRVERVGNGDEVIKVINEDIMSRFPHVYESEKRALEALNGAKHFPKLTSCQPGILKMSYCGEPLTKDNMPPDWEYQMYEILHLLKDHDIVHNDLLPRNLLVKDGIIYVIDFGIARMHGEPHPSPLIIPPDKLAQITRENDSIVLRRSLDFLRGKTIDNYSCMPLPERIDWLKKPEWQAVVDAIEQLGTQRAPGSSVTKGHLYHEVPFHLPQKLHRIGLKNRVARLIASGYDFKGKKGLDLGCSVGGLTFSMQQLGAECHGIEADPQAFHVAVALEDYYNTGAQFRNTTVERGLYAVHYDFCLYLSLFMWIVKSSGINVANNSLITLGRNCPVMFFETSVGDSMAGDTMKKHGLTDMDKVIRHIESVSDYRFEKDLGIDPNWSGRSMIMMKSIFEA